MPRQVDSGAALDLFGSSESDEITDTPRPSSWSDDFLKAKLSLFSEGYVYHPRFMLYRAAIAPALKRELYEDSGLPQSGWQQASGFEYDFQLTLLPEHSYNLMLYARRVEPLARDRSSTLLDAVDTSWGGLLRYRRRPWFGSAGYTDDTIETAGDVTRVRKLDLNGQYLRDYGDGRLISFTAAYVPSRFTRDGGFDGSSSEATASNILEGYRMRLTSTLSRNEFEQSGSVDGAYGSDYGANQFLWYEQFTAELPHHLRTWVEYRYLDSKSRVPQGSLERRLESRGHHVEGAILHQLYESLESSYTLRYYTQDSTTGSSEMLAHELAENYTKRVRGGRLQANLSLTSSLTDNRGRADVIREGHQAVAVPGSFALVRTNVDPATLTVYLRSPVAPFEAVLLAANVHYTLGTVGAVIEVRVLGLPPPFVVPGSYTFEVTYSMLSGRFSLRTDTLSHGASLDLFATRLTPYYSFIKTTSEVREGIVPGFLPDATTWTVGVRSLLGPWRARAQYQDVDWAGSPYTAWDAEVQYVGPLGDKGSLYATISYVVHDYERTPGAHAGRAYREETESASANLQRHFFDRTLTLAGGGGYTRIRSLVDTQGLTWNASLAWNVGKLSVSAGASSYMSEFDGPTVASPTRLHRYYFLRVNRQFF